MAQVLVTLLDPRLCQGCRFAREANVEHVDGRTERKIACLRGDCDNWEYETQQPIKGFEIHDR